MTDYNNWTVMRIQREAGEAVSKADGPWYIAIEWEHEWDLQLLDQKTVPLSASNQAGWSIWTNHFAEAALFMSTEKANRFKSVVMADAMKRDRGIPEVRIVNKQEFMKWQMELEMERTSAETDRSR